MTWVLPAAPPALDTALAPQARASRPDALDKTVLLLTLGVWAGHILMLVTLFQLTAGQPSDPATLAKHGMAAGVGIVLCLGVYALFRRGSESRPWALVLKVFALCLPLSVVLMLVCQLGGHLTSYYRYHPGDWLDPYRMVWTSIDLLWILLTWSALFVGATVLFQVRQRDLQLTAMREATQQAELHALRSQINPHFLFNTLNTLAGLIRLGRREESERMVLNLSRFLRLTLSHLPSRLVPLADEIAILRMYLKIERARFGDRLAVRYEVPADCLQALVPGLVLLPLAENSIKYALANAEDGIEIRVGARHEGDRLALWLEDTGTAGGSDHKGLGIGLSNIRQQLAALFGDAGCVAAGPAPGGWHNLLHIPWQEESQ